MTYEDRIRQERPGMSKSFAKLADFLLDSYIEAAFMTASELAHRLDLDAATVVRFAQTLEYKGFPDMQREIRKRVLGDLLVRPEQAKDFESIPGVVGTAMEELSLALEQTRISLDTDALANLVEQIGAARRIILLVENPAQAAAYNLVHFLEQGGFPIYRRCVGDCPGERSANSRHSWCSFAQLCPRRGCRPGCPLEPVIGSGHYFHRIDHFCPL